MGAALAAITVGAWFAYSALTGKSLTDVFKGGASNLNPGGTVPTPVTGAGNTPVPPAGSGDRPTLPSPGDVLPGAATVTIDGVTVAGWIAKQVLAARQYGWTGTVSSGVRSYQEQQQACIHVCGNPNGCPGTCAKPGTSNHRGTRFPLGAVDVTDPPGFAVALARAKQAGAITGPVIRNNLPNDRVHFSFTGR